MRPCWGWHSRVACVALRDEGGVDPPSDGTRQARVCAWCVVAARPRGARVRVRGAAVWRAAGFGCRRLLAHDAHHAHDVHHAEHTLHSTAFSSLGPLTLRPTRPRSSSHHARCVPRLSALLAVSALLAARTRAECAECGGSRARMRVPRVLACGAWLVAHRVAHRVAQRVAQRVAPQSSSSSLPPPPPHCG